MTDACVVALAERCPQLTHIYLAQCYLLRDVSVMALAENCPELTNVDFDSWSMCDESVIMLAVCCLLLAKVDLYDCHRLTV